MRGLVLQALLGFCLAGTACLARAEAPEVDLQVAISRAGREVSVTLSPSSSAAGCAYVVYASSTRSSLRRSPLRPKRIALIAASDGSIARNLTALRPLQGARSSRRALFFRSRIRCADDSNLSRVRRVLVRPSRRGIRPLETWLTHLGTRLSQTKIQIAPAYPALQFSDPVAFAAPPDAGNRVFVVEQGGRIYSFLNSDDVTSAQLFLDISSRITNGGELGLLGLAFHPSFAQNGQFFLNYTEPRPGDPALARSVISRFTLPAPGAPTADAAIEERLVVIEQPFSNHNGGALVFGNDGYLYCALGDGGSGGDPLDNAQNRASLLGKVLRIDIDNREDSLNYAIPPSNPFAGNTSGFREEIFAYGLRNPFRMSVDPATGLVWAGDVGQGAREEIDILVSGANYGWNSMEGSQCYPPGSSCSRAGLTLPVAEYGRDVGASVIGGYVYRGTAVPALIGSYVYADFVSGRIFGLIHDGKRTESKTLLETGLLLSSFGEDSAKELYLLSYDEGKIYRITGS